MIMGIPTNLVVLLAYQGLYNLWEKRLTLVENLTAHTLAVDSDLCAN